MYDLININPGYVQNSVAFSRNREEELGIASGKQEYSSLSNLLAKHINEIDALAECASEYAAIFAVNSINETQYHDPNNGKLKNAWKRNVSVDPIENSKQILKRNIAYNLVRGTGELALKFGSRKVIDALNERERYKFYSGIYFFLDLVAHSDERANQVGAVIELEKIRSSFDLNARGKRKLKKNASDSRIKTLDDINFDFLSCITSDTKLNLAYLLFSLVSRMYDDDQETIESKLHNYYCILGYQGKRLNEVIRIQRESYSSVMDNQHKMHIIARQMVCHIIPDTFTVDYESIAQRGREISLYDPYAKRRNVVKKAAKETAKVAASVTIQALCSENPAIAILAASEALSQFNLNNDMVREESASTLYNWFGSENIVEQITGNAKSITEDVFQFE